MSSKHSWVECQGTAGKFLVGRDIVLEHWTFSKVRWEERAGEGTKACTYDRQWEPLAVYSEMFAAVWALCVWAAAWEDQSRLWYVWYRRGMWCWELIPVMELVGTYTAFVFAKIHWAPTSCQLQQKNMCLNYLWGFVYQIVLLLSSVNPSREFLIFSLENAD